jgi:uncharacterized protein YjiS (DUF1127 family)
MLGIFKLLAARRIRNRLHRLDDRLLKDIGLCRSDIDRIAADRPASSDTTRRNIF